MILPTIRTGNLVGRSKQGCCSMGFLSRLLRWSGSRHSSRPLTSLKFFTQCGHQFAYSFQSLLPHFRLTISCIFWIVPYFLELPRGSLHLGEAIRKQASDRVQAYGPSMLSEPQGTSSFVRHHRVERPQPEVSRSDLRHLCSWRVCSSTRFPRRYS